MRLNDMFLKLVSESVVLLTEQNLERYTVLVYLRLHLQFMRVFKYSISLSTHVDRDMVDHFS